MCYVFDTIIMIIYVSLEIFTEYFTRRVHGLWVTDFAESLGAVFRPKNIKKAKGSIIF